MRRKLTTEEFIERSRKIHGNKYDYSKVNYFDIKTPVEIICPHHFNFSMRPCSHLSGQGCFECGKIKSAKKRTWTTEKFIEKARKVHGNKYDYSKVNYSGNQISVEIICPIHGSFLQSPNVHLAGHGCPNCAKNKKLTTETFIEKARKIHGDRYDYSKVNYIKCDEKVEILCKTHLSFYITPESHLRGAGCSGCAGNKPLTTETFIEKAKEVHGDRYDYFNVNYSGYDTNVNIICSIHGDFLQSPSNHLQGEGCYECGIIERSRSQALSQQEFIERSNLIHDNKYDYSKVNYVSSHIKVNIICPVQNHGEFSLTPGSHLSGTGCSRCSNKRRYTTDEFITKAKVIHGNKYDYSKVNYINAKTKVEIVCPIKNHSSFYQPPHSHLRGRGCFRCALEALSNMNKNINISKGQTEFLDYLNITNKNVFIDRFIVDGLKDNVIYEFLGDYWHGNPKKFDKDEINKTTNKTFGKLYSYTFWRFRILKGKGYEIKYIWESDWSDYKKGKVNNVKVLTY